MSRQRRCPVMVIDNLFVEHLLPLRDVAIGALLDEAALPPLHRLSSGSLVEACSAFHLVCQGVDLVALRGPAVRTALDERRRLSLIYVESGELELLHPEHGCLCSPGTWVLVPGSSLIWNSSSFSVICLLISPEEFALHLEKLCSAKWSPRLPALPEWPHAFQANLQDVRGVLLELLTGHLQAASRLYGFDPALLDQLEIGDYLCKIVAALSLSPSDSSQQSVNHRREDFYALIRYIRANLDQPLNLTVLAAYSHYSRRTLQYAFRNWLGCTATQWIRRERLDLAWQLLQQAGPGDNVTSIAQSCGYRSLSLFSIEFQHRFHIKPSVLLRSARVGRGGPSPQQGDSEPLP